MRDIHLEFELIWNPWLWPSQSNNRPQVFSYHYLATSACKKSFKALYMCTLANPTDVKLKWNNYTLMDTFKGRTVHLKHFTHFLADPPDAGQLPEHLWLIWRWEKKRCGVAFDAWRNRKHLTFKWNNPFLLTLQMHSLHIWDGQLILLVYLRKIST